MYVNMILKTIFVHRSTLYNIGDNLATRIFYQSGKILFWISVYGCEFSKNWKTNRIKLSSIFFLIISYNIL